MMFTWRFCHFLNEYIIFGLLFIEIIFQCIEQIVQRLFLIYTFIKIEQKDIQ